MGDFYEKVKGLNLSFEQSFREKIAEAERLLGERGNKAIPPYAIKLEIVADDWKTMCLQLAMHLDDFIRRGPDGPHGSMGGGAAWYHRLQAWAGTGLPDEYKKWIEPSGED